MQTDASQDNDDNVTGTETRGAFLRKIAKTVAIGLGVALVPATQAWAVNAQCCRDDTCGPCRTGEFAYRCTECSGYSPSSCCQCQPFNTPGCQQYGCGVCSSP